VTYILGDQRKTFFEVNFFVQLVLARVMEVDVVVGEVSIE